MRRHWMAVLLCGMLTLFGAGCASEEEVDARCKRDLEQMRANEEASERYYGEISTVLVGLSDDLDRESARTEADKKAAELASAVGDEITAATYASDAAAHEKRVVAINEMLEAPPPPFPETVSVSPNEQDWMVMNECANAARMRRLGLESMVVRKRTKPLMSDEPTDPSASEQSCDGSGVAQSVQNQSTQ